jgi:hypothetical protein
VSLVDRVREEIRGIVAEEIGRLKQYKEYSDGVVEKTESRLKNLVESYKELEKELNAVDLVGLRGLTSSTAKVMEFNQTRIGMQYGNRDWVEFHVEIGGRRVFTDHPGGPEFGLDIKKKYKILVAFIEVKEEKI